MDISKDSTEGHAEMGVAKEVNGTHVPEVETEDVTCESSLQISTLVLSRVPIIDDPSYGDEINGCVQQTKVNDAPQSVDSQHESDLCSGNRLNSGGAIESNESERAGNCRGDWKFAETKEKGCQTGEETWQNVTVGDTQKGGTLKNTERSKIIQEELAKEKYCMLDAATIDVIEIGPVKPNEETEVRCEKTKRGETGCEGRELNDKPPEEQNGQDASTGGTICSDLIKEAICGELYEAREVKPSDSEELLINREKVEEGDQKARMSQEGGIVLTHGSVQSKCKESELEPISGKEGPAAGSQDENLTGFVRKEGCIEENERKEEFNVQAGSNDVSFLEWRKTETDFWKLIEEMKRCEEGANMGNCKDKQRDFRLLETLMRYLMRRSRVERSCETISGEQHQDFQWQTCDEDCTEHARSSHNREFQHLGKGAEDAGAEFAQPRRDRLLNPVGKESGVQLPRRLDEANSRQLPDSIAESSARNEANNAGKNDGGVKKINGNSVHPVKRTRKGRASDRWYKRRMVAAVGAAYARVRELTKESDRVGRLLEVVVGGLDGQQQLRSQLEDRFQRLQLERSELEAAHVERTRTLEADRRRLAQTVRRLEATLTRLKLEHRSMDPVPVIPLKWQPSTSCCISKQ